MTGGETLAVPAPAAIRRARGGAGARPPAGRRGEAGGARAGRPRDLSLPHQGAQPAALPGVVMEEGKPFPFDRVFALARPGVPIDASQPRWAKSSIWYEMGVAFALARRRLGGRVGVVGRAPAPTQPANLRAGSKRRSTHLADHLRGDGSFHRRWRHCGTRRTIGPTIARGLDSGGDGRSGRSRRDGHGLCDPHGRDANAGASIHASGGDPA